MEFELKYSNLNKLPLLTKSGNIRAAKDCYLPSELKPRLDLEKIVTEDIGFIDYKSYRHTSITAEKVKSILLQLQVKEEIHFFCGEFNQNSDSSDIDKFEEYSHYITNVNMIQLNKSYHYHIAYLPYMSCLKLAQNQDAVIEGMKVFKIYTEHIEKELQYCLPRMQTKFGSITINLAEDLMKLLGARNQLTVQIVIKLINAINSRSPQKYHDQFQSLYKQVIASPWDDIYYEKLKQSNSKILASDGSLQYTSSLYFIPDKELCGVRHRNLLKSFSNLTVQDVLMICRYFGVQILTANDYKIIYDHPKDNSKMKTLITNLLKMVVITEAKSTSYRNRLYKKWHAKLNKLDILAVKRLALEVKANSKITFKIEVILTGTKLLHDNDSDETSNLDDIVKSIATYLELSEDNLRYLEILSLINTEKDRLRWLEKKNYNVNALLMIDENCIPDGDIQSHSDGGDTTENVTHLNYSTKPKYILESLDEDDNIGTESESKRLRTSIWTHKIYEQHSKSELSREEFVRNRKVSHQLTLINKSSCVGKTGETNSNISEPTSSSEDDNYLQYCKPVNAARANVSLMKYDEKSQALFKNTGLQVQYTHCTNLTNHSDTSTNFTIQRNQVGHIRSISKERENNSNENKGHNRWTGRWGEEFAFQYYTRYYRKQFRIILIEYEYLGTAFMRGIDSRGKNLSVTITWLNYSQESNSSADIKVIKNNISKFIEVKTTYRNKNLFIKISQKEWQYMCQLGKNYRLCCIYNAGIEGEMKANTYFTNSVWHHFRAINENTAKAKLIELLILDRR
ncbi:uncharacterized protein TRIADDRAFT_51894 [Trichoplax adhaerens]|uniref:Protein NO VEIN C-terminal domain-containing protein n=1 Tax=Trichoplax adhaerens TaxID=10228 RepID=B3RL65_TRIAD|nr:predicted protein [Trichoplax adhaerens]EDV29494.1 predicted protein [Trichoplax adhaerens]|eukprot:XP_002108696.1 predicted protein [Trichoplax adhaerens]